MTPCSTYVFVSGSFYLLLLLASLGLIQVAMDRRTCPPEHIISFANNLRDPSGEFSSCCYVILPDLPLFILCLIVVFHSRRL